MVYNSYTSRDVKHLIQYLAENNPDGKARRGNKIYQQLVDNQSKWPWSKNHPWQSWRDHFVKNEAQLNKKIRIYQKEHGISTEAQRARDGDKKATKGDIAAARRHLAQEEEEDRSAEESIYNKKRMGGKQHSPSTGTRKRRKIMRERREVQRSSLSKDVAPAASHFLAENEFKMESSPHLDARDTGERQEVAQMLASDEQIDWTSTPDTMPVRRVVPSITRQFSFLARKVPTSSHSNDSFDSLFDANPDILVPDSEEELGDPSSGKGQHRSRGGDFLRSSSDYTCSTGSVGKRRIQANPAGESEQNVDLDVVESKSSWPPVRNMPQTSCSFKNEKKQVKDHKNFKRDGSDGTLHTGVHTIYRRGNDHLHTASDANSVLTSQRKLTDKRGSSPGDSEHAAVRPSPIPPTRQRAKPRASTIQGIFDDPSSGSGHDSTDTRNYRVDHAEQDVAGDSQHLSQASQKERHVDLHEERKKGQMTRRLSEFSRGASISTTQTLSHGIRQSPLSLQLSTQDQSLVTSLGIQQAIAMMSKNHGFTEDVVSRILGIVNSIPRADEILRDMRVKAEEAAFNHLVSDEPPVQHSAPKQTNHEPSPSRTSKKFEIRAKLGDEQMSDYSPPSKTRAGQFSRLMEQGRLEEAYAREAHRASGIGSPTKNVLNAWNAESRAQPPVDTAAETEPRAIQDEVFRGNGVEEAGAEVVRAIEDTADLQDAHAAMACVFDKHEGKLNPQRAFQRFEQTARILKQVLIDYQGHS